MTNDIEQYESSADETGLVRPIAHQPNEEMPQPNNFNLAQIEQAKQEWEATVDAIPQLVCLLDQNRCIIRANRTVERWGLARVAEVKGIEFAQLLQNNYSVPANYLKVLLDRAWEQLHFGHAVEYELNHRVMQRYLLIQMRPTALYGKQKNKAKGSFAAVVVHDITEQKKLAKELQKANEQLAKLNADKDKFFSIVAHDLKGPFLPVLGNAQLMYEMADRLPASKVKEISGSIYRSGKRVLDLLENLLAWTRLQMGRLEYTPSFCDLSQIAENNVELLLETATNKGISLHSKITPETMVYADSNMLDTVIRNLTNNALKFTPEDGSVTISAHLNGEFIEVSIADTGIGISEADLQKLFRMEHHHTTVGTANEEGTGLGLVMCQELIQMSGGQVWITSQLGQGTIVKFTVPTSKTDT